MFIIFFSFFYTALQFNPDELADNIKKSGGFIPGIRPGKKTAEFFNYILMRIRISWCNLFRIFSYYFQLLFMKLFNLPFYLSITEWYWHC